MSRIANEIRGDISSLTQFLTQKILAVESRLPEIKVSGSIHEIGWSKDGANISPALKDGSYSDFYNFLYNHQQYNMVLYDGSLFQFLYRFEKETLVEHRVCYLPQPKAIDSDIERDLNFEEFPLIRIDFSPSQHKAISHSATHMHLGYVKNCRIPTAAPVDARAFVLFILRSFYPDKLKPDVEAALLRSRKFDKSILSEELETIHLYVPSAT